MTAGPYLPLLGAGSLVLPPGGPLPAPPPGLGRLDRMDRLCALSLLAAEEAQRPAAATAAMAEPGRPRVGVVFGSAYGCHENDEAYYRDLLSSGTPPSASPRLFVYTLPSSPAGEISIHLGLRGPVLSVVSGGTAGLEALAEAGRALRRGRAALALACAAEVWTLLLERLEGQAPGDGAAALLLGVPGGAATRGHLGPVATSYCPGDPARALGRAIEEVLAGGAPPERVLGDRVALDLLPAALPGAIGRDLVPPGRGTFGALAALSALAEGPLGAAMLIQTDPRGHGAAALWLR